MAKKVLERAMDDLYQPEGFDENVRTTSNDGIELPFLAPFASWYNGNPAYKSLVGRKEAPLASFTGGWSLFVEAGKELAQAYGHTNGLFEFGPRIVGKDERDAFLAQHVACVVIGQRERWLAPENPAQKSRSHTQVLVYCAEVEDGALIPYGPMVLTVKGINGKHLKNALTSWMRFTQTARAELAKEYGRLGPFAPSLFWMMLGVFGKDRKTVPASGNEIVPISVGLLKDEIDAKRLRELYVGRETAEMIRELGAQAQEWLNDKVWKSGKDSADAVTAGDERPPYPELTDDPFGQQV